MNDALAALPATRAVGGSTTSPLSRAESAIDPKALVDASPVGLMIVDASWRCAFVNRAASVIVGRDPEQLVGVPWIHYAADKDVSRLVDTLRRVDDPAAPVTIGHEIAPSYGLDTAVELTIAPMVGDGAGPVRFAVAVSDVSLRRKVERDLVSQAKADRLTGLPNRATVMSHLSSVLERRRPSEAVVVAFIDLDGFKPVNESLGHETGYQVLVAVGRRLRQALRAGEMVGRIGGDEFVACVGPGEADPEGLGYRILRSLEESIAARNGHDARIGASIGLVVVGADTPAMSADEAVRFADAAMYVAKRAGGGRFHLSVPRAATPSQAPVEADLHGALGSAAMRLHYQPVIDTATSKVSFMEALVRWYHPVNGVMYPEEFLPALEHIGAQRELTDFVVAEAVSQVGRWRGVLGEAAPAVSINLSAFDLADPTLVPRLSGVLDDADLPEGSIRMEINEGSLSRSGRAGEQLVQCLREGGVPVSIDNFGSSASSIISRLGEIPAETLKLDRSFIRRLSTGVADDVCRDRSRRLVTSLVDLAHGLDMTVVAEGVEYQEDLVAVAAIGFDMTQGYFHGHPVAAEGLVLEGASRKSLLGRRERRRGSRRR
jgi:diguanylate cyclase (GGDEF)-like protein/PAS domain S-box-containing protein